MSYRMATAGPRALRPYPRMFAAMCCEALGTYFFVFLGTATVVELGAEAVKASGKPVEAAALTLVGDAGIGLAFGFAVLAAVYAFGRISGAHINPAVTVGLTFAGKFPIIAAPFYIAAQFGGALLASLTVRGLFPDSVAVSQLSLGATVPTPNGDGYALLAEFVITFILMLVVMATVIDERVPTAVAGLALGATVAAGVIAVFTVSGASFNPARAIAPMIVSGKFTGWWVYLVGPTAGGIVGALLYQLGLRFGLPSDELAQEEGT